MTTSTRLRFCRRPVAEKQLSFIKEMTEAFWGISRTELVETICELLEWEAVGGAQPSGRTKAVECRQFLEALEAESVIKLSKQRKGKPKGAATKTRRGQSLQAQAPIHCRLKQLDDIVLKKVDHRQNSLLWRELIDRDYYFLLLETFVDKARFSGGCYRAANWVHLGETKGRGRIDRTGARAQLVRDIWVYPLRRNWRNRLLRRDD